MKKFPLLEATDIDVRVAQITAKGASLLLYKDARVDMTVLDDIVGSENWQRSHFSIDGVMYCRVSIWDSEKQAWVSKEDCGSESNVEKDKGASSDSFKRACFNWGIGRELYSAPFIWIPADKMNISEDRGKFKTYDTFSVKHIGYDESNRISALTIQNDKTRKVVYELGKIEEPTPKVYEEIHCEKCKSVIQPTTTRDGSVMSPSEVAEFSRRSFNRVLCAKCIKEENHK